MTIHIDDKFEKTFFHLSDIMALFVDESLFDNVRKLQHARLRHLELKSIHKEENETNSAPGRIQIALFNHQGYF